MGADPLLSLLITATAVLITTVITALVTVILSVHHTRRQQIEYHGVNVIADAVADCINATHRGAAPGADPQEHAEAAARRAAARQLLTNPASPTTLIQTALTQPHLPPDGTLASPTRH